MRMELRIYSFLALLVCSFLVVAEPNAEHKLPKDELPLENLRPSNSADELEGSGRAEQDQLNEDKRVEAPRLEVHDFPTPRTDRRKRQFGFFPYGGFGGGYGTFYKYNPYTMTTATGWYNPYGGATAVSGFFPYPYAFNQAYLFGR